MPANQSPGAVGLLYSGKNQSGDILACGSSAVGARYDRWFETDMQNAGALYNTRSVTVYAAQSGAAAMMLFSEYNSWGCDFGGEFVQYTNAHPQLQWDVDVPDGFYWPPDWGNLPKVRAMLMVQTQRKPELRVSYRNSLIPLWNQFVSTNLPKQVKVKGAPRLSWMAFPQGMTYLSQDDIYLYVEQEIEVNFSPYWANYDARFEFWVRLRVIGGKVKSHVQRYSYWVESGAFSAVVEAILKPNLQLAVGSVEASVDQALSFVPSSVTGLYYLPGKQLNPVVSGYFDLHWESVDTDVTIVFEV